MMKKLVIGTTLATAMALSATVPAFADECGNLMKTVEEAASAATVKDGAKTQASDLLAQAKEKQAAGDSKSCVTLLTEATKVLAAQ